MSTEYILNTDINAQHRLNLQHHLYHQSSFNLLLKGGLSKGQKGLEIGCGTGMMSVEISKLIGNSGKLIAIDTSNKHIESAKELASNCSNINFQIADVNKLGAFNKQFDFVYCRMVLHHLDDASPAFAQMINCLKPKGVLICEEPPLLDGTFCYPPSRDYEQYVDLVENCFIQNNKDYQIAYRLAQEAMAHNLSVECQALFQPILITNEEKMIYAMGSVDLRSQIVRHGLLSEDKAKILTEGLIKLAKSNGSVSWLRMHQIIARKQGLTSQSNETVKDG